MPPSNITPPVDGVPRCDGTDSARKEILATGVNKVGDVWVDAPDV